MSASVHWTRMAVCVLGLAGMLPVSAALRVEHVDALTASQVPALRAGDVLVSVQMADSGTRPLETVFDWLKVEYEWLPAGPVEVTFERDGQRRQRQLRDGHLRVLLRAADPQQLPPAVARLDGALADVRLQLAREHIDALQTADAALSQAAVAVAEEDRAALALVRADAAFRLLRARDAIELLAAVLPNPQPADRLQALAMSRLGNARGFSGSPTADDRAAVVRAVDYLQQHAPGSASLVDALRNLAIMQAYSNEFLPAQASADAAIAASSGCLDCALRARALQAVGVVATMRDDLAAAVQASAQAIAILDALPDPSRTELASQLNTLSHAQAGLGQYAGAAAAARRMLEIARSDRGRPRDVVLALNRTGNFEQSQGRYDAAIGAWTEALALAQQIEPDSFSEFNPNLYLGRVYVELGDLARARSYFERARQILVALNQNQVQLAQLDFEFGQLETIAGRPEQAIAAVRSGLALVEHVNAAGQAMSQGQVQLGVILAQSGALDEADAALRRAREIAAALPDCYCVVPALRESGWLALRQAQTELALAHFDAALKQIESQNGPPLDRAGALHGRGAGRRAAGQLDAAAADLNDSIALYRRYSPDSPDLAQAWFSLGQLEQQRAQPAAARSAYCAATEVLDRASGRVGGDSLAEAEFRSRFNEVYRACLQAELELGHAQAAFMVLERSRARSFLDALEQRVPAHGAPGASSWLQRWAGARQLRASLQAALQQPLDAANRRQLEQAVDAAQAQARANQTALAAAAPALGAVLVPGSQSLTEIQGALPAAAMLLAYSLDEEHAEVFALTRERLDVYPLKVGRRQLATAIGELRALIAARRSSDLPAIRQLAGQLYRDLLGPLAERLDGRIERLLISPEGPLHALPFALLDDGQHYLIERYPLAIVDSASSMAALDQRHRAGDGGVLGVAASTDGNANNALRQRFGLDLASLPAAASEVQQLRALYPENSELLLDAAATEAAVVRASSGARLLHFAVHAVADDER
ncbi:MAG TPA: CHAT domain-containing protein, partial [Xanthomonadales bacterium]|nr:CHAT domain-containing protein [Xanthomonadales bacterium]